MRNIGFNRMIPISSSFSGLSRVSPWCVAGVLATICSSGVVSAQAPSAPGNVTVTAASASRVVVSWSPVSGSGAPIAVYIVYRGSSSSLLPQLTLTTVTSFTDNSVGAGVAYYYAVAAENAQGLISPLSSIVSLTVPMAPSAPSGLVASVSSGPKVGLAWSPANSGGLPICYYQILRGASPSSLVQVASTSLPSYTDRSVSLGAVYYYAVTARDWEEISHRCQQWLRRSYPCHHPLPPM